jgi:hypothetical protein
MARQRRLRADVRRGACDRADLGALRGPAAGLRNAAAAPILLGVNCSVPATNLISRRFIRTSFPCSYGQATIGREAITVPP